MVYGKIKGLTIIGDNTREFLDFLERNEGKSVVVKRETGVRSGAQNNALHLYFEMVAKELNDAGYPLKRVLERFKVDLDLDASLVKETLWRPIQRALTGKESTTALDKVEDINRIYEHVNRFLAEQFHVHVPFPHGQKVENGIEDYPMEELKPTF